MIEQRPNGTPRAEAEPRARLSRAASAAAKLALPTTDRPTEPTARPTEPKDAPMVVYVDDDDSPVDVIDSMSLAAFLNGTQPFAASKYVDNVRDDATLMPEGATISRGAKSNDAEARLVVGDGWTLRSVRWRSGGADVRVTATSEPLATSILDQAVKDAAMPEPEPNDSRVDIGFWYMTPHGPRRRVRPITAAPWTDLRRNYAASVADAFDRLIAVDADHVTGQMLLLHGPPGTGKTTALRSLARQWRPWCQLDFVMDPERLFAEPGYLTEVIIGDTDNESWRMLLLEDCDELIRTDAKRATGQSLSRLLNLTDGLLGQGRRVIVAITTNENLARLHPAVTRPGRCLAQIEVSPLSYEESVAWLGTSKGVPSGGATLAELYAVRDGGGPVTSIEPAPAGGFYL